MSYTLWTRGYNGFNQISDSQKQAVTEWSFTSVGTAAHTVVLCWDAVYYICDGVPVRHGYDEEDMQLDGSRAPCTKLSAVDDRVAAVCEDGRAMLYTPQLGWRQLTLQQSADYPDDISPAHTAGRSDPIVDISINEHMIAACTRDGRLLTLDGVSLPSRLSVVSLSCGREHIVLLTSTGVVYTYGGGGRGQLGLCDLESRDEPGPVTGALAGLHIKAVAVGGWHSLALSSEGDVYAWGWNEAGQLGSAPCDVTVSAEPRLVEQLPEQLCVQQICCGSRHSLALADDGTVWGWGWNGYGQLTSVICDVLCPTRISAADESQRCVAIAAGGWSSAVVTKISDRQSPD